jgi:hypothetical protein
MRSRSAVVLGPPAMVSTFWRRGQHGRLLTKFCRMEKYNCRKCYDATLCQCFQISSWVRRRDRAPRGTLGGPGKVHVVNRDRSVVIH